MEIFSPPRIAPEVTKLGLRASVSLDLTGGWNALNLEDQKRAFEEIVRRRPAVVMLSPPWTWFSQLQNTNWGRMPTAKKEEGVKNAVAMLDFACRVATYQ
eukprot:2722660-Alexandrium_andersonii.AAC.1